MPIGSFWMHNVFVRYDGRTMVKRECERKILLNQRLSFLHLNCDISEIM